MKERENVVSGHRGGDKKSIRVLIRIEDKCAQLTLTNETRKIIIKKLTAISGARKYIISAIYLDTGGWMGMRAVHKLSGERRASPKNPRRWW